MHVPIYKDPVSLNSNQFLLVTYTKTKFQHKLLSGSSMDTEVKSLMRMSRIKFDKSSFVLFLCKKSQLEVSLTQNLMFQGTIPTII